MVILCSAILIVGLGIFLYKVTWKYTTVGLSKKVSPALKTAQNHPMKYYVSLPANWSPGQKWPILVNIEPAGAYFEGAVEYARSRGDLPFIIVTPFILSNRGQLKGNDKTYAPDVLEKAKEIGPPVFDQEGLLEVVRDVQKQYSGQERFYLTGWSAGGHLTWMFVFHYPEKLAGAVLAAGNYSGRGMETKPISAAPERDRLPVKEFLGDRDKIFASLQTQWQNAAQLAEQNGFHNFSQELVKGAGHNRFAKQVLAYFESLPKNQ